jgi:hypothetical protein
VAIKAADCFVGGRGSTNIRTVDAAQPSVVDWIAAWGQVGGAIATTLAVIVALWVALGDRRRHRQDVAEAEILQARLITIELKLDSEGDSATIIMTNNSAQPVFQPSFSSFSIWSGDDGSEESQTSSGLSSTDNDPGDHPATEGLTVEAPPCEVLHPTNKWSARWSGLSVPAGSSHSWMVMYHFTDAAGRRWRRTNHLDPVRDR